MSKSDENPLLQQWIRDAKRKQTEAQRQLYSHFYGYAMSVAIRYAGNREEAEEIVDDSFIKVFNNLDKYNPELSFRAWLRRILINTAIDYHRKYQKYHNVLEITHAQHISVEADGLSQMSAKEILALVQQLAPSYRVVFNLYVLEGYKHKEISEKLGITEATSRATLATARLKLQKMILTTQDYLKIKANG